MENKKYKILVLSDLKESDSTMLKNTVSVAKMINGDIHFLCVKKPTEIVKKENQLSAMRSINEEHFSAKKSIENLIKPIAETYKVNISHSLTYGNLKNEIGSYIKEQQPDIIVVGKRKSNLLSLMGDNVINYVFKQHKGTIMVSGEENVLEPNNEFSLGLLNENNETFHFAENLMEHTQKPLKSFKIVKNSNSVKTSNFNNKKKVEYVFEDNDNAIKNLSNYLLKSNINLLCVNREIEKGSKAKQTKASVSNIINNLNVSLFFTTGKI